MTTTPRPVLLMLLGALALAVPAGWLMGEYLGSYGVPIEARVVIGLLIAPATFALTLIVVSVVSGLRERDRMQGGLQPVARSELDRARAIDLFERMQELDRSPLVRVIGIGRVIESDGITVEFLALELRERGGVVTLRAHGRELAPERGEVRWPMVTITDDARTPYVLAPGGGGGGEDSMQYELRFVPSPPPHVPMLDIGVVEFSSTAWPFAREERTGAAPESAPWRIAVDLR
jgi:hypothetical protein